MRATESVSAPLDAQAAVKSTPQPVVTMQLPLVPGKPLPVLWQSPWAAQLTMSWLEQ